MIFQFNVMTLRPIGLLLALLAPAAHAQTANPQLAALALNLPAPAPAPPVRYDNPMADTLAWLRAKLQRHDYRGLGERTGRTWLGADKMSLEERENGPVLSLQFTAANNGGPAAAAEAKVAFQRLVAGGPFKPGEVASHSVSLEANGHETFNCYTPAPARMAEIGYLILTIYTFVSLDHWLADEAAYHGKFPGTIAATDTPQVWEVRGRGTAPDSYQRFNGVFQNGVLVRGSKTFHGYGPYLDGVWLSNHWTEPGPYRQGPGTGAVEFRPAGTTDVVYGVFDAAEMQHFHPALRHLSSRRNAAPGGFYPDAPIWLRKNYLEHNYEVYLADRAASEARSERARLAQQAEDAAHPEAAAARRAAAAAPVGYETYYHSAPARTYQPTDHEGICGACGGSGWITGTVNPYGQSIGSRPDGRRQCGSCGGRGKSTSKY